MNKKETKAMQNQMILDRLEVKGIGAAWCHLHQCRPHTCFTILRLPSVVLRLLTSAPMYRLRTTQSTPSIFYRGKRYVLCNVPSLCRTYIRRQYSEDARRMGNTTFRGYMANQDKEIT
jgi:hypothetical protein